MTRRTTPVPRRRPFPDITDDFALDDLLYEQADVDQPYPNGPAQVADPDAWTPPDDDRRGEPKEPLEYPQYRERLDQTL